MSPCSYHRRCRCWSSTRRFHRPKAPLRNIGMLCTGDGRRPPRGEPYFDFASVRYDTPVAKTRSVSGTRRAAIRSTSCAQGESNKNACSSKARSDRSGGIDSRRTPNIARRNPAEATAMPRSDLPDQPQRMIRPNPLLQIDVAEQTSLVRVVSGHRPSLCKGISDASIRQLFQ
jgi:hypothetical protein